MVNLLYVCTANITRSPTAALMTEDIARERRVEVTLASAGCLPGGRPMDPDMVDELLRLGFTPDADRPSREVDAEAIARADLILTMERRHLRHLLAIDTDAVHRSFTLRDFARRSSSLAPATLGDTIRMLDSTRNPGDVLRSTGPDDLPDPHGRRRRHYRACAAELLELSSSVVSIILGCSAAPGSSADPPEPPSR